MEIDKATLAYLVGAAVSVFDRLSADLIAGMSRRARREYLAGLLVAAAHAVASQR